MFTNPANEIYDDILYFKSLYPDSVQDIYRLISDYCDKLEYNNSIMYDEYPDKERMLLIVSSIRSSMEAKPSPELVMILLINEFVHRRIRRRAYYQ